MRTISKGAIIGTLICGLVFALLALSLLLSGSGSETAQADGGTGGDPNILGIDVKIDDDADTTPDNTQSSLGTIDNCIEVATDDVFQVDVFYQRRRQRL